jgi:hypothetical protein
MEWVYDDAGRGFRSRKRAELNAEAISILLSRPLETVELGLQEAKRAWVFEKPQRESRLRWWDTTLVPKQVYQAYMAGAGWVRHTTMKVGKGCKTHLKADELPATCLVQCSSGELVAVVDRVIHCSWDDMDRGGTRCVYSWWTEG